MLEEIMERLKKEGFGSGVTVFEDHLNALRTRIIPYADGLHYGFVAGVLYTALKLNIIDSQEWRAASSELDSIVALTLEEEAADASGI